MPKKVLPTSDDIERLTKELAARKFSIVQGLLDFMRSTKDERAIPPHPRTDKELGFIFQKDGLKIAVWTTWLVSTKQAREHDCGWVLIEGDGKGKYFIPVHRTKHFIDRLIMEALIARTRIRVRPLCPKCKKPMVIQCGTAIGSRYWQCPMRHASAPWDTKAFDELLPESAKKYLAARRKQRKRWQKLRKSQGKPTRRAAIIRKGWRRTALSVTGF